MKTAFLFLLIGFQTFAQSFIQKTDGTKIMVSEGSIKVEPVNKRLTYYVSGDKTLHKIKYKDFDFASFNNRIFKSFKVKKKAYGFFVMGEADSKQLAVIWSNRIINKGGFDVPYKRYEIAVIDNSNAIVETISFTDVRNEKNDAKRSEAIALIKTHFERCPTLLNRLTPYENTEHALGITKFLEAPDYISCK